MKNWGVCLEACCVSCVDIPGGKRRAVFDTDNMRAELCYTTKIVLITTVRLFLLLPYKPMIILIIAAAVQGGPEGPGEQPSVMGHIRIIVSHSDQYGHVCMC